MSLVDHIRKPNRFRSSFLILIGVLVALFTYFNFFSPQTPSTLISLAIDSLGFFLMLNIARRSTTGKAYWILLTVFMGIWFTADLYWGILEVVYRQDPSQMISANALFLLGLTVLWASSIVYLVHIRSSISNQQIILDVIAILILIGILAYYSLYGRINLTTLEPTARGLLAFAIFIDLSALINSLARITSMRSKSIGVTGLLLSLGSILFVSLDLFYYVNVQTRQYQATSQFTDYFYFIAMVLFPIGALFFTPEEGSILEGQQKRSLPINYGTSTWMIVALLPAIVLYLFKQLPLIAFLPFVVVIGIYLLFSNHVQLLILYDHLLKEKTDLADDLEKLVQLRTKQLAETNDQLLIKSITDPLTGLYTRQHFHDVIDDHIANEIPFGILTFDYDKFKYVNDTFGHSVGDELLMAISHNVKDKLPAKAVLARLGGDEFGVVPPAADISEIYAEAKSMTKSIEETVLVDQYEFETEASLGISVYPTDSKNRESLLKFADQAMYESKTRKKPNKVVFYNTIRDLDLDRKVLISNKLASDSFLESLYVHYMPIYNLQTGIMYGMEALVRWYDPELGMVTPSEFIPFAEDGPQIGKITEFVLDTATTQLCDWNTTYKSNFQVGINISPRFLNHVDFYPTLDRIVSSKCIRPNWVNLEITESASINPKKMDEVTTKLLELGFNVSFDQYGVGLTSLTQLNRFRVNQIKLSKFLIDNIHTSNPDCTIVNSILTIARGLNLETAAEGIELQAQLDVLKELGCQYGQGFYFGQPVSAAEFERKYLKLNGYAK